MPHISFLQPLIFRCLKKQYQNPVKLIATKAIGQYFFLIKNIIIRFAHKIKFLKEQLWQKENIEKYGLENTNIVNDIFEIILYSNEESL